MATILCRLARVMGMLTGDNKGTTERIAKSLGTDIVFADLRPGDKASKVKELQPQRTRIQHRRSAPSTICTETGR
jgi:cation transport ATPase